MKTYKATDNSLHCIDPEFAHLLPTGSIAITDEEADALRLIPESVVETVVDPVDKLRAFLLANPDVAAIL